MISLVPGITVEMQHSSKWVSLDVLLIASHEKAFIYTTVIVIYIFVKFEVITFINMSQSITKFGNVKV